VPQFKVLLIEPVHQKGLDYLKENGCEVIWTDGVKADQILASVSDVDAILARAQGTIDRAILEGAPVLKVIGRHGIGVDNIDVDAATELGIHVVNTPHAPVEAVAEYVVMSLIALPRRIGRADLATRQGNWGFRNEVHAPELLGKTLGIIGFGRIGRRIAEICSLGFGMTVQYADAFPASGEEERRLNVKRVEMSDLLSTSDYITLNVPLLESTHHLINPSTLAQMKPHAILVNCSRGPVVDENALYDALAHNQIGGAVLDVFEQEPISVDSPLLTLDNILLSPHYSGHSKESSEKMSMVAGDIVKILNGKKPAFPVNQPEKPRQPLS
jgi:D-3-phosphoglycerate dehydrogenase / 2-oxoglutarate reductase